MDKVAAVNGKAIRIYVPWRGIAPANRPAGFNAEDPGSPSYDFSDLDGAVSEARARGLQPILMTLYAPDWAEGPNRPSSAPQGTWKPNPTDVADFGTALARRYSGGYQGLPQVKDYMLWNEENLPQFLTPQRQGGKLVSDDVYKDMLNAFYAAVHGISNSNRVITGGTAPYGGGESFDDVTTRPLEFWRDVLCVKGHGKKVKGKRCPDKPSFDVLAHHPIDTSGGPTTSAIDPDDVSMPDVHNLVDVLRAAEKAHNVKGGGKRHQVWATEFWWESNPPDKAKGNPSLATQARWYEQSLYLLWRQGVSLALFYQIMDEPHYGPPGRNPGSSYETGVFFINGKPKPSSRAVSFPFVVQRTSKSKAQLWGIAPSSGKLEITQKGKGKKSVAGLKAKQGKVFTKTVRLPKGKHKLTAQASGQKSLTWTLKK